MSSISTFRTTGNLPILTHDEYRHHLPPLPMTWNEDEIIQWNDYNGIYQIIAARNSQLKHVSNVSLDR